MVAAWVNLQAANSLEPQPSEEVSRLIPSILELINQVYGFPGYPETKRAKERQKHGRTTKLLGQIEERITKLP